MLFHGVVELRRGLRYEPAMHRSCALGVLIVSTAGVFAACGGTKTADVPAGGSSASLASSTAPMATGSTPAPVVASASVSATASTPPPPAPLTVPSTWTPFASKKLGLSFSYPKETFKLTETATRVSLVSTLSRDELGGDPKPKKWVYGAEMFLRTEAPAAFLKKDYESFYKSAFPGGKFKETESISATKFAGKDGYKLMFGVEGYNTQMLVLPKGTGSLVLQFRSIGGVMGPNIPEADQTDTFERIQLSFKME